jgi:N-acetylglucosamine transport system substrate-binding protein
MKKFFLPGLVLAAALCVLNGCAGKKESAGAEKVTINILWQQEVTETFMDYAIAKLKEKHPGVTVNLNISPQAFSEINNLIAAKNAPDVFFSWISDVDYYGMMKEGLLNPVDNILEAEAAEGNQKMKERLLGAGLELGALNGSHYLLPVTQYQAINFYDKAFFNKNGIAPQFASLADTEKTFQAVAAKTGAAPLIYAGVYSFMAMDAFILPLINNADSAAMRAINAGTSGAWTAEPVIKSVQAWENLVKAGYVTKNSLPMDHIQSQIEFINNRAAVVPAGTWLEGEMSGQWPQGFELTPFLAPAFEGQGHTVVPIIECMILPKQKDDTNLPYVAELLRFFYSKENAQKCLKETGALMAFENVDSELMALLPASVQAALAITRQAEKVLPAYKLTNKKQFSESSNLINGLTSGEITARQFCEQMEALSAR